MAHRVKDDVHAADVEQCAAGVEREVEEHALVVSRVIALPYPLLIAEVEDFLGRARAEERAILAKGPDALGAAAFLGQEGPGTVFREAVGQQGAEEPRSRRTKSRVETDWVRMADFSFRVSDVTG
jgi:hypothetical protein